MLSFYPYTLQRDITILDPSSGKTSQFQFTIPKFIFNFIYLLLLHLSEIPGTVHFIFVQYYDYQIITYRSLENILAIVLGDIMTVVIKINL